MTTNTVSNSSVRVDQLPLVQNVLSTDTLLIVSNPNDPNLKALNRIVPSSLFANSALVLESNTPANSTANVIMNSLWFDNNYIYVAIANNIIKRVALSSF